MLKSLSLRRGLRGAIGAMALATCAASFPASVRADEVVVGHLSTTPVTNLKAIVPHKVVLTGKKPASILSEPAYRGTPQYGSIRLGNSKKSVINIVLDTFPGDKAPHLYMDILGTGNLADKSASVPTRPLTEFAADSGSVKSVISAPVKSGVPIGAVAPTLARYDINGSVQEIRCPVLFTVLGDELDYTIAVQNTGTVSVGGKAYRIALVDTSAEAVFNNYTHADDKSATVKLLIDINDDGKFDPKHETFDLSKPFRLAGTAYEIASVDPAGTILALHTTTKRPEGAITPDDLAVGTEIIDFVARAMDGSTIKFPGGYKHKVVMLDFWATWCGPCVAEIPNIVSVYNQYHANGFEIVGVSLDRANQRQTVLDFCQSAMMTWPQIYDGGYWNAEIAKLFGVDSIPRAFLVDGDTGTILAMGDSIRGDGLQKALTKALTKKGLLR